MIFAEMNPLEFVASLWWPIVVLSIVLIFRSPISTLLLSLRSLKYRDLAAEFEMEESDATADVQDTETENIIMILQDALSKSAHSYDWIRDKTPLTLSDKEFDDLALQFPKLFRTIRIVQRDANGQRIIPGKPGMKLAR
jgi:hypothetical protein